MIYLQVDPALCSSCGDCDNSLRESLGGLERGILESVDCDRLLISKNHFEQLQPVIQAAVDACKTGALSIVETA